MHHQPEDHMNTLESFTTTVQDMVRKVGETFTRPDENHTPVVIMQGRDGVITVGAIVITCKEDKIALPGFLQRLVKESRPNRMALMLPCWELEIRADNPLAETTLEMSNRFGVRDHPDRYESLHLECGDRDGNYSHWRVRITRHPDKPPTLGDWESVDDGVSGYRLERVVQRAFLAAKKET